MSKSFEYGVTTIGELQVETKVTEDKRHRRRPVTQVLIDDEPLKPTERFWTSLYIRYGFSKSFFNYFTHEEVFSRISEVSPNDRMRYCIERDENTGKGQLLAVSNPTKSVVHHDDLMELLELYQGGRVAYHNGIVESHHIPRMGGSRFHIAGDEFANRFVLQTPIDGFGLPNIYLSLLREICSNGMVGFGKTFRSQISVGKGHDATTFSLMRALDGFGNDEGYAALRQRFESAASSWASVHEALSLYNLTARLLGRKQIGSDGAQTLPEDGSYSIPVGSPLLKSFHKMTGDISSLYGLANLDALSAKRQRTLPVNCKVYDLLNFATEVATHHAQAEGSRRMQAWVAELLTLLADELAKRNYDARSLLRDLALTRAYQRSCDAPQPGSLNLPPAADEVARLEGQRTDINSRLEAQQAALAKVHEERKALVDQVATLREEITGLEKAALAADETAGKAQAAQQAADGKAAKGKEAAQLVTNAAVRTSVAVKKIPGDKAIEQAFALLDERAKALVADGQAAAKMAAELKSQSEAAAAQAKSSHEALATARAKLPAADLARLDRAALDAQHAVADARYAVAGLDAKIASAKAIGEWQAKQSGPALAEPAWQAVVDRWSVTGQVGQLRPLTCEQFARSLMQVTGVLVRQHETALAAIDKKPPDELKNAAEADRPRILAELAEERAFNAMRGDLTAFVNLYGTLQGDDFQATVNQALFFGNGSLVQSWLVPAGGNLTERLAKLDDAAALSEELYLSVLTRLPSQEEKDEVAALLGERLADRPAAITELVWALVSSNEFRFNH